MRRTMLRMLAANSLSAFSVIPQTAPALPGGGVTHIKSAPSASAQSTRPTPTLPSPVPSQATRSPRGSVLNLSV